MCKIQGGSNNIFYAKEAYLCCRHFPDVCRESLCKGGSMSWGFYFSGAEAVSQSVQKFQGSFWLINIHYCTSDFFVPWTNLLSRNIDMTWGAVSCLWILPHLQAHWTVSFMLCFWKQNLASNRGMFSHQIWLQQVPLNLSYLRSFCKLSEKLSRLMWSKYCIPISRSEYKNWNRNPSLLSQ